MKSVLSILMCLLTITLQAQTVEKFLETGKKLYGEGKYLASAKEYDKAFHLQEGNAGQYYDAACSWALSGDTIQSIKYLKLSAEKGWINLKHIKKDKDLLSLHTVKGWNAVLKK